MISSVFVFDITNCVRLPIWALQSQNNVFYSKAINLSVLFFIQSLLWKWFTLQKEPLLWAEPFLCPNVILPTPAFSTAKRLTRFYSTGLGNALRHFPDEPSFAGICTLLPRFLFSLTSTQLRASAYGCKSHEAQITKAEHFKGMFILAPEASPKCRRCVRIACSPAVTFYSKKRKYVWNCASCLLDHCWSHLPCVLGFRSDISVKQQFSFSARWDDVFVV